MKTYGAEIYCRAPGCHAEPYPDDPATTRETFDLVRVGEEWRCELHRSPQRRASRAVAATPRQALARLEETLAGVDNDDVARALNEVKRAIAAQTARAEKAAQAKRPKPLSLMAGHPDQVDFTDDAGDGEDSL
jgi:hypothetical protein